MGEEEGTRLALALTQGLDGDSTIEQNADLWKLANGKISLQRFWTTGAIAPSRKWNSPRPRWREDDAYVKQMTAIYSNSSMASPVDRHHELVVRRMQAESQLPELLRIWGGSSLLEDIRHDLADAQKLLPYRETGKHYLMLGYETIRMVLVELSQRWNLGRDVFFMTLDELPTFEAHKEELPPVIAARKIRWQSARRLDPSDVVDSRNWISSACPRDISRRHRIEGRRHRLRHRHRHRPDRERSDAGRRPGRRLRPGVPLDRSRLDGAVRARPRPGRRAGRCAQPWRHRGQGLRHPRRRRPDATKRIRNQTTIRVDGNRGRITLL